MNKKKEIKVSRKTIIENLLIILIGFLMSFFTLLIILQFSEMRYSYYGNKYKVLFKSPINGVTYGGIKTICQGEWNFEDNRPNYYLCESYKKSKKISFNYYHKTIYFFIPMIFIKLKNTFFIISLIIIIILKGYIYFKKNFKLKIE